VERYLTNLYSLGPQTIPIGLHRRSTRHRDLVQSRFGDVNHLRYLLRGSNGVVPALEEDVHQPGSLGPARLEWCR